MLAKAAQNHGISLVLRTNAQLICDVEELIAELDISFVLFWDKDILLGKHLEALGLRLYNPIEGIKVCDSKALTYQALSTQQIPMPKTIVAPMTYANIRYTDLAFLDTVERKLGYPMIVKESYGSFGWQVYLVENCQQLEEKTRELEGTSFLYQEFVENSRGRDVRLQVVGDQVVAAMYRYSETDFRANITNGGSMKAYHPTKKECELAVRCCKCLNLDFAGVDLLFGQDDEPLVCEVNANAHFKNLSDCTGIDIADEMISYIVNKERG